MIMLSELQEMFDRLLAAFGPQHWWPGESPFEVMVGAVLVQNTAWRNVERAIANLRQANLLDPHVLYALRVEELAELIRPAGYYQVKARRLRNLLQLVVEAFDGSLNQMFAADLATLRSQLLRVHGIGPETADAILLYAGGVPTFVVDTYAHRILARHGWIGYDASYDEVKELFEASLPADAALYNEYHALLVRVGKDYCKRSQPRCAACPLACMLPEFGVVARG
jgi:endonuclease-3 related protein